MSGTLKDNSCLENLQAALANLARLAGLRLTVVDTDGEPCCNVPHDAPLTAKAATLTHVIDIGRGQAVTLLGAPLPGERAGEHADACVSLVEQAVRQAIDLDDLCEEVCTRFEELNLFYQLASHTMGLDNPQAVATVILEHLLRIVGADRGSILLASPDADHLEVAAAIGGPAPESLIGQRVPRPGTVCGEVLEKGEPLVVQCDPAGASSPRHPERQYKSDSFACMPLASLPLKVGSDLLGIMNITDKADEQPFSSGQIKLLEAVAAQTSLLVQTAKLLQKNKDLVMNFARSLSYAIDAKDSYTHGHSLRVTDHALGVAKALQLSSEALQALEIAGLLHDIGKIGIPEHILNKKGPLTDQEYAVVKEHPEAGAKILSDITEMSDIALYVRHHHEHYDGSGYPDGLAGQRIPLPARILAIADAYDAITSTRPYRGAAPRSKALAELKRNAGSQFDDKLVDLFVHLYGKGKQQHVRPALKSKYPGMQGTAPSPRKARMARAAPEEEEGTC